ncbi:putative quorum-sensing-regulated virulence factor protein [Dioscorea alata]|uniref:Quorum-sensing-regulated virulence factor protein n=1 Tax=Dioscorea alata TaxID=55571 RepID=A0ACB7WSG4_DIOAL|nr:putative quorum-sensing-regulated virulence factor protein [Dioscorea alata]
MASFYFSIPKLHPSHNAPSIFPFCSSSFFKPTKIPSQNTPARDRTIDFGKHKGRKLGSLPSNYLLWISRNLRARDFEHWAKLADEVLADDVYKDRLEWEAAQRVLTGDGSARSKLENSAAELLEISQRFGWDYEDRDAWSRVDFALLGTSSGGRIPRKSSS